MDYSYSLLIYLTPKGIRLLTNQSEIRLWLQLKIRLKLWNKKKILFPSQLNGIWWWWYFLIDFELNGTLFGYKPKGKLLPDQIPFSQKMVTLNGIWSWWQFCFPFWTKWDFIWFKIEREIFTTIIFHSIWKKNLIFFSERINCHIFIGILAKILRCKDTAM